MNIRRVGAIAAIVAGLAVVSAGTLVGAAVVLHAKAGVPTASEPVPILGPITPAGHPYDQLAILRRQRMSTDVMPASVTVDSAGGDENPQVLPETARLIASQGDDREYLTVSTSGGICVVSTTLGSSDYVTACNSGRGAYPSGTEIMGVGSGYESSIQIISDGTPRPGVVEKGNHQVEPNIWVGKKSKSRVPAMAASAGDPLAFPRSEPYSDYSILRRDAVATDAPSKQLADAMDDMIGSEASLVRSSLRRAGVVDGSTVWAAVDSKGEACVVIQYGGDIDQAGFGSACVTDGSGAAIGFGSGKHALFAELRPDRHDRPEAPGATHLAPNVWVTVGAN